MDRFCTACGSARVESAKFCTVCGLKFVRSSAVICNDSVELVEYEALPEYQYQRGLGYGTSSWHRSLTIIGLSFLLIISASLIYFGFSTDLGGYGYVSASTLNCRAEPDPEAKVIDMLPQDSKVVYLDRRHGWAEVKAAKGRCWISEDFVSTELWRTLGSRL